MHNEKDNIEKLYAEKFGKFESQTSEEDWNALYSKLRLANFMKFSMATFNIYFLITFLALAGSSAFLGVNSWLLSKKVKQLEKVTQQYKILEAAPSDLIIDSVNIVSDEMKPNSIQNKKLNSISTTTSTKPSAVDKKDYPSEDASVNKKDGSAVTDKITKVSVDSSTITKADSSIKTTPEPSKIRKVKKTVVIKQDKVIIKDTVVIKKTLRK